QVPSPSHLKGPLSVAKSSDAKLRAAAAYRDRNREKLREDDRRRKVALKDEALARYGTVCQGCGFDNRFALCIDHVDDNGAEERKSLGGQKFSGWKFYDHLKKQGWPDGYQTLCA